MKQNLRGPFSGLSGGVAENHEGHPHGISSKATGKPSAPVFSRIFVVAYNRLLRETLGKLLAKRNEFKVVGQSAATSEMADQLVSSSAEILLLHSDANLESDLSLVRTVRQRAPGVRIMMLGMSGDAREFLECLRAGIAGYVLRDASSQRVLESVQVVCRGGAYCDPTLCRLLFNYFERSANGLPVPREPGGLTEREQELVPLLARGASNKEIADQFSLSEQTVKNHLYRMKQKVGAPNRVGLVELCRNHGLDI